MPRISIVEQHNQLNLAFQNDPTQAHNVFVTMDWIIGEQEQYARIQTQFSLLLVFLGYCGNIG